MARAEFGLNITHVPRAIDWAQAGGALLDVGIYCVQFLSMVFQGQKPEKILAVGRRYETGRVLRGAFDGGVSAPGLLCLGSPLGGSTRDAAVGSPAWPGAAQVLPRRFDAAGQRASQSQCASRGLGRVAHPEFEAWAI